MHRQRMCIKCKNRQLGTDPEMVSIKKRVLSIVCEQMQFLAFRGRTFDGISMSSITAVQRRAANA